MHMWPEPIALRRVVFEEALACFVEGILAEQSPEASVGAITVRPRYRKQGRVARALVYVGPLEARTPERLRDLLCPTYIGGHAWDLAKLFKTATATAGDPRGY